MGSDRTRYGKLIEDLENEHTQGVNKYPHTLTTAYSLLVHWKQNPKNLTRMLGSNNDGVAFTMTGDEENEKEEGTNKTPYRGKSNVTCHKCGKKGHYAPECKEKSGSQFLMSGLANNSYGNQTVKYMFA